MDRRVLLAVPVGLAVIGGALFLWQGGFGGGHGDFDQVIWFLGLPGTLITTFVPVWPSDLLALVVIPAVVNVVAWVGALHLLTRWQKARRT